MEELMIALYLNQLHPKRTYVVDGKDYICGFLSWTQIDGGVYWSDNINEYMKNVYVEKIERRLVKGVGNA